MNSTAAQTTEAKFTELLTDALDNLSNFASHEDTEVVSVRSFKDAFVMASHQGVVVRMSDGTEFQVSVVQSQ